MNYSTELPEGFQTWSELRVKCILDDGDFCLFISAIHPSSSPNHTLYFEEHFIKSKCYDELMELALSYEDIDHDFISDFKNLTHSH